jgi:hypothetical protein
LFSVPPSGMITTSKRLPFVKPLEVVLFVNGARVGLGFFWKEGPKKPSAHEICELQILDCPVVLITGFERKVPFW